MFMRHGGFRSGPAGAGGTQRWKGIPVTYQAMKLLGFPETSSSNMFGADDGHRMLTSMYVALVAGALCDIHRDRRAKTRGGEAAALSLDAERIGQWFCDSASREGHALCGAYEAAAWMFRHLDAILSHYAAADIVFVADGSLCRDGTAGIIEALAEQRAVELARRVEQHLLPQIGQLVAARQVGALGA